MVRLAGGDIGGSLRDGSRSDGPARLPGPLEHQGGGWMEAAPGSTTRRRVALTITILGFSVFAVYIGLWLALIVGGHTNRPTTPPSTPAGRSWPTGTARTSTTSGRRRPRSRRSSAGAASRPDSTRSTTRRTWSCRSCRSPASRWGPATWSGARSRSACSRGSSGGSGPRSRPSGRARSGWPWSRSRWPPRR